MTISFDDSTSKESGRNQTADKKPNGASYNIEAGKRGHYYNHPQWGRVKVVALFCDCGRSILVKPADAKDTSIVCDRCDSAFRWQQLTFASEL